MEEAIKFIMEDGPHVIEAMLAVLGGMKILSRYTPWKWDDQIFDKAEACVRKAWNWLPKKKR